MGSEELEAQIAALAARVEQLERQLSALGAPVGPPVTGQPAAGQPAPGQALAQPPPGPHPPGYPPAPHQTAAPVPHPAAPPPPPPSPPKPPLLSTEAALKWAGILLVVLAAVFFVGTVISRGWIGPELQLAGATVGGLALIAAGFRLLEQNRPWAVALATGGALVVSICAAAANAGLDLIDDYPALALLAVVTVGLGVVSHRLTAPSVAAAAGLAAALLPLWIVEDDAPPVWVVGGWTVALVLAASGFGWRHGWIPARLPTVIVAALLLLGLLADNDGFTTGETIIAIVAVAIVAAAAWAGPIGDNQFGPAVSGAGAGGGDEDDIGRGRTWTGLDHRAVLSVPIWTWGSIALAADVDTDRSVAVLGFALTAGFVALVAAGWAALPRSVAGAHLLGAGILLAVSMAVLTDGPGLLVGLAAQAAATAALGWWLRDRWLLGLAAALAMLAVGWAAVSTLDGLFDPQPTGQLLANLFVIALLAGTAVVHRLLVDDELSVVLMVVAWVGVLGWIASAFGHRPQGQVIVSLLWSILAAAALVYGVRAADGVVRTIGITTLGVVLVKLLTVDLAEVDTLWRVGLFLIIGTGLLRLGYVLPRLSSAPDPPASDRSSADEASADEATSNGAIGDGPTSP